MKRQQTRIVTFVAMTLSGLCGLAQAAQPDKPANATGAVSGPQAPPPGDSDSVETVVVTGFNAALERSLAEKRAADSVIEVVSAEDIGKLPDKNVADAVQRVPGVNIASGSGGQGGFSENDRVSIRGTSPSLTQTTINGHSVATGDWFIGDQTNTVGRSVSFTLLPSEIVGSVQVEKSSQADYIEGGTVGNVNVVTRKPLDLKKKLTAELTAQGLYSDAPGTKDPQLNALVGWKNPDNTIGVLFQGFYEARHERRDGQELLTLGQGTIGQAVGTPGVPADPVAVAHPDLAGVVYPTQIGSAEFTQHSKRTGGLFDLEFQPTDALQLDVNGFYSHFAADNYNTNFMASPANELATADPTTGWGIPTSYTVVNGTLESATFPNARFNPNNPGASVYPGVRDSIARPGAFSSASYVDFDTKFQATDALSLTSQIGYTRGIGQTPHDDGYEAFLINSPLVYQMHGITAPAIVQFPGVDTTNFNSDNVVNGGSFAAAVKVTDEETYGQVDGALTLDQGILHSIKFGVRYSSHKRTELGTNFSCAALNSGDPCLTTPNLVLPKPAWNGGVSPNNFGSAIGFGPGYLQHYWVLDPNAVAAWQASYENVSTGPNYQGNFTIEEKDAAGYGMVLLRGERWRGNIGLRLVNTRQDGSAFDTDPVNPAAPGVPTSSSHTYNDVLPSANLKVDLTKDLLARFAASKTLSRADYSALSPAVTLNNLDLTGNGGNADLKPVRSNNYDAGLEWYFAPQSILSVGLFYMDMPSYVTFGNNTRQLFDTQTGKLAAFAVTSPFNIAARNEGVEVAWQQPLGWGFGALANYTYANGRSADGQSLVGSSKSTTNAELYYDHNGLNVRVSYTYRSAFLVGLANVTQQFEAGLANVAATVTYRLNDNVLLTFDGLNLNNPRLKYYANAAQPEAFYSNGRQYYLGVLLSL